MTWNETEAVDDPSFTVMVMIETPIRRSVGAMTSVRLLSVPLSTSPLSGTMSGLELLTVTSKLAGGDSMSLMVNGIGSEVLLRSKN